MRNFALLSGALITALAAFAAESGRDQPVSDVVLVEINGVKVTLREFEQKHPMAFFQARNSFHDAQRKVVDTFIDEYLLEEQAKKENLTVDELLKKHVDATIAKDPSEETLRVYYEGVDTKETYEAVRDKIVEAIHQRRLNKAKSAYMLSLRSDAKIFFSIAPPRAQISMKDTPVRGPADTRVMLVEYADYECPYCQQAQPTLDKLEAEFKGRIAFAYKDVPLPMHPNAPKAAEASHCAEAQGKYWEYHDLLGKTRQLDMASLKDDARKLSLDGAAFDKCLDSGEKSGIVKLHQSEAASLGIQGTPTFLVNGRVFSGSPSYEQLRVVIEEELNWSTGPTQQASKR
jgi:predicted DsbA family dithiol-disulfide isomerase